MNIEDMEDDWLNEFDRLQKWQWGIGKSQLKYKYWNVKSWSEMPEGLYMGEQRKIFGEPASILFTFSGEEKLTGVKIVWESPTSGAYIRSKLAHIKKLLDKRYGESRSSDFPIQWETDQDILKLSIEETENRMIMNIRPKDLSK